jgi:DICT domain-containing protein
MRNLKYQQAEIVKANIRIMELKETYFTAHDDPKYIKENLALDSEDGFYAEFKEATCSETLSFVKHCQCPNCYSQRAVIMAKLERGL